MPERAAAFKSESETCAGPDCISDSPLCLQSFFGKNVPENHWEAF